MYGKIKDTLKNELQEIKEAGLYKKERIITSSQDAVIKIASGQEVINFCANNYYFFTCRNSYYSILR